MLDSLKKVEVNEMMRLFKIVLISFFISVHMVLLSGCWNYREVEKMSVVAGVAIDKGDDNQYSMTVEIVEAKGGQEHKITPKVITMTGNTLFDTIRNTISVSGKRLYWSHTKVLILSKNIAEDDMVKILDWYNRDAETRADMHILVSKEKTAKEIIESKAKTNEVVSFEIDDILENEKSLSKSPNIAISDFIVDLAADGISPITSAIGLQKTDEQSSPKVMGTAIFDKNKFMDFLSSDETKILLFIKDMVEGGVLVQEQKNKSGVTKITLEIIKSKTKIEPIFSDDNVNIKINIETTVAIDEIQGKENYMEEGNNMKLQKDVEKNMNIRIKNLVKKVQSKYNTDIFGFGKKIKENLPDEWKKLESKWKKKFKNLEVTVDTKINIKNSAALYKTLPVGD